MTAPMLPDTMMNWGCGPICPPDWINVDVVPPPMDQWDTIGSGLPHVWDAATEPVPDGWADMFDGIVANHSLCAVDYHDVTVVLPRLLTCLKPGGTLRVILPDIHRAMHAYRTNNIDWFPNRPPDADPDDVDVDDLFCQYVTWYSTNRTVWTPRHTLRRLRDAGFTGVVKVAPGVTTSTAPRIMDLDDRQPESFYVEATRPTEQG